VGGLATRAWPWPEMGGRMQAQNTHSNQQWLVILALLVHGLDSLEMPIEVAIRDREQEIREINRHPLVSE
tara:strand:+ start:39 stop:248 length:210 start_codon:yes stop_codon:yes gene_type:complete